MTETPRIQRRAPVPGLIGHNGGPPLNPSPIAADMAEGAGEIALFLFGKDTPEAKKKVFRLAALKVIRCGKLGGKLVASKRKLAEDYDAMTN